MDVLLTHGYFLFEDPEEREVMRPYPPLGILYLSSYLKEAGFEVEIFDSTFRSRDGFRELVRSEKPPVVGIYANMMTRTSVLRQISVCRNAGAKVVLGGPDPANYPGEYLDRGADVVVIGEGERTLEELLPRLHGRGRPELEDVAGIVFRDGDDLVRTDSRPYIQDLDAQPYPDREAIDIDRYVRVWREHHGRGSVSLITARGCPYKCTWCSHAVFGYTYRWRSVEDVADEVELILDRYDPDMLWYADDVFTIKPSWFYDYAEELEKRGIRIPFETISREDRLDEDVIETLADMGCFRLWVGAESGSQEVLDAMKRRTDAERVVELVHQLQDHGIEAGMFVMLGYEGEEMDDIEETVTRLKQARPDRFLTTVAYPIKDTPYYEEVEDRIVPEKEWAEGSDRDLTVAGRHSRRFYENAMRWMNNEVAYHKEIRSSDPDLTRLARSFVGAKAGRVGMWWTRNEVETG